MQEMLLRLDEIICSMSRMALKWEPIAAHQIGDGARRKGSYDLGCASGFGVGTDTGAASARSLAAASSAMQAL